MEYTPKVMTRMLDGKPDEKTVTNEQEEKDAKLRGFVEKK